MADVEIDNKINSIILEAISQHTFPGAVVGYLNDTKQRILPYGHLTYNPTSPAVTADTVYDLASVTKSIPTATLILILAETGKLSLDDPVEKYIPEMAHTSREKILIRHLLTFTAVFGLKEHLSITAAKGRDAILQAIFTSPLRYLPGKHYYYSDAPYILLGLVAEKATGKPLDILSNELLFTPLSMLHTTFYPETLKNTTIAPTEITAHWILQGEAHDVKSADVCQGGFGSGSRRPLFDRWRLTTFLPDALE